MGNKCDFGMIHGQREVRCANASINRLYNLATNIKKAKSAKLGSMLGMEGEYGIGVGGGICSCGYELDICFLSIMRIAFSLCLELRRHFYQCAVCLKLYLVVSAVWIFYRGSKQAIIHFCFFMLWLQGESLIPFLYMLFTSSAIYCYCQTLLNLIPYSCSDQHCFKLTFCVTSIFISLKHYVTHVHEHYFTRLTDPSYHEFFFFWVLIKAIGFYGQNFS